MAEIEYDSEGKKAISVKTGFLERLEVTKDAFIIEDFFGRKIAVLKSNAKPEKEKVPDKKDERTVKIGGREFKVNELPEKLRIAIGMND